MDTDEGVIEEYATTNDTGNVSQYELVAFILKMLVEIFYIRKVLLNI